MRLLPRLPFTKALDEGLEPAGFSLQRWAKCWERPQRTYVNFNVTHTELTRNYADMQNGLVLCLASPVQLPGAGREGWHIPYAVLTATVQRAGERSPDLSDFPNLCRYLYVPISNLDVVLFDANQISFERQIPSQMRLADRTRAREAAMWTSKNLLAYNIASYLCDARAVINRHNELNRP
jgi:hypothetical protein